MFVGASRFSGELHQRHVVCPGRMPINPVTGFSNGERISEVGEPKTKESNYWLKA